MPTAGRGLWTNVGETSVSSWCFSPYNAFTYYDCCRDVGSNPLGNVCFDDGWYTYERCCQFQFGPEIRGLPYMGTLPPVGFARLNFGNAGLLSLELEPTEKTAKDGANQVWMNSWYYGSFLANLPYYVSVAGDSWDAFRQIFAPLARRGPLRILDLGCGVGAASLAAARAGHNVTAVDVDPAALTLVRRNARRNGVRANLRTLLWSFVAPMSRDLQARMPFDVVFAEVGGVLVPLLNEPIDMAEVNRVIGGLIRNLHLLDARVNVFIGGYRASHTGPDSTTSIMLQALTNFARQRQTSRICGEGEERCERGAAQMSPPLWLESLGVAPPMRHALVLW